MNSLKSTYGVLANGDNLNGCISQVLRFFDKTLLVNFDETRVITEKCYNGADPDFGKYLEEGLAENRRQAQKMIDELKKLGCETIDDVKILEHGYPSKIFHTLAHIIDGFIDIDSAFYNVIEDSHGVTEKLRRQIQENPEAYWLITVEGEYQTLSSASLIHT